MTEEGYKISIRTNNRLLKNRIKNEQWFYESQG